MGESLPNRPPLSFTRINGSFRPHEPFYCRHDVPCRAACLLDAIPGSACRAGKFLPPREGAIQYTSRAGDERDRPAPTLRYPESSCSIRRWRERPATPRTVDPRISSRTVGTCGPSSRRRRGDHTTEEGAPPCLRIECSGIPGSRAYLRTAGRSRGSGTFSLRFVHRPALGRWIVIDVPDGTARPRKRARPLAKTSQTLRENEPDPWATARRG